MTIVFSHWSDANIWHEKLYPEMAALSNYFAQKGGYQTILYTDKKGYDLLKNIEYDNIKLMPEEVLNQFPKTGWSLGKLWVAANINQPFLHFDFDLFLLKPLTDKILDHPAIFFHSEIWMDYILKNSCKIIKKHPTLINNQNYRSYNCAIFGGKNYKAFNKAAKNICEFAIENADFLDKICTQQRDLKNKKLVKHHLYLAMILEQLWLPQILLNDNIKIKSLLTSAEIRDFEKEDFSIYADPEYMFKELPTETKNTFKYFYSLLNKEANQLGTIHYYSKNKSNYREKIVQMAIDRNLKF